MCGAGTAAACVLYLFPPATTHWYPPCLFSLLTGLRCGGCGTLRGIHALLHGRFGEALGFNALMVAVLPLALGFAAAEIGYAFMKGRFLPLRIPFSLISCLLAAAVLFTVARNLWQG